MKKYLRFKYNRKSEYHLITEFTDNLVIKYPYCNKAESFYKNVIQHNLDFRKRGIPCVELVDNLTTKWVLEVKNEQVSLEDFLTKYFSISEKNSFELVLFGKKLREFNFPAKIRFCLDCDIDLSIQNFICNPEMLIVDLEWKVDEIPLDYLLWKSGKIYNQELVNIFKEIEKCFQQEVVGERQLEDFQYGKYSYLSSMLNNDRENAEHQLYIINNSDSTSRNTD